VDGIDDHRHCKVCGKPCGLDREVCSKACRATLDAKQATRQNYTYLMYGIIAFLVLVLVLQIVHL
jgi:predicted nucleic acid-binding Zn ribbon protein